MNLVKNLTPELEKAEAKDRFYQIEGAIKILLAPQDKRYERSYTYTKKASWSTERVELTQEGTPTDMRAPRRRRRIRKGESQTRGDKCWSFKVGDKHIFVPWGTNFGVFKSSLFRSVRAQKKEKYSAAPLELMRVYPTWLDVGKAPCESMKDGKEPQCILTKRHGGAASTRVEEFFDYIENRSFKCFMEVDSENPINEEKFVALIKTLNTLDTIGPGKRGKFKIEKVARVELSVDEIEKMEKGEPVEPVVY